LKFDAKITQQGQISYFGKNFPDKYLIAILFVVNLSLLPVVLPKQVAPTAIMALQQTIAAVPHPFTGALFTLDYLHLL
jgi:hypothetical protein